ncbi:oxygen-independent coproporphyrinogen III oxidase [Alteromonas mediterranea]|uniref:Coproporphyrinogen-III oxidase n=1 Tax=Alteromonas mediterranea TaxID=314275 RepID=A0AAC9AE87_9ALTE|nr:oxygen-independent coproporphyrinogen III oxidase [Alteromonas mediterranea]AFV85863.1 coproporphyrinogen III oxidase [Alteromonas mediterranea DE1]AGP97874.1 coproporphyrinogen III oxidase [Alteromonas mediterranea UM7]AGQ02125.1 coproporphyrinogen III oxidase [Alteromonas mediterranea UM4b]AMJ78895.1 coproporphyrinogen III oxidase [Alteromonas mediterranea]AMJ83043.1 coproporphyrinogen III oxidase [Alteromonas mediterranea]|tara:strand:- start:148 stop:1524 length:1377 start_codon:yes stop_codon:yes gene_type:complete
MNTIAIKQLRDNSTITKYAQHAPRYTSYPTALKFESLKEDLSPHALTVSKAKAVSLYVHIPFCKTLCYYCGCNKLVTRHNEKADDYLDYLEKEIVSKRYLADDKPVVSLHLGGGSPSFLNKVQHTFLMYLLKKHFTFEVGAELSIELDPRNVDKTYLQNLRGLGYTRISFGLQDTDYNVQKTINRVQSTSHIADLVSEARTLGFESVNLDLIYGLPNQSEETFASTIAATKAMMPDRISLFSYAHLPERFAAQRKFAPETLPSSEEKAALYNLAVNGFTKVGYEMIGLDHFALRSDSLAIAKHKGKLHRNFQGYTLRGDTDLIGVGVSAISTIGNAFTQNAKDLKEYYKRIDRQLPSAKVGLSLTPDDLVRRDVISSLMCNLSVDKQSISSKHHIIFDEYFSEALSNLERLADDGIIEISAHHIRVPEHARIFIRAVCARFDAYLNATEMLSNYSKAI